MFLRTYPLTFIALLSSLGLLFQSGTRGAKDLELGLANIQSVVAAPTGPAEIVGGIVIRISDSKNLQSFGVTNDVGILVMPLPPGEYCFDAFSLKGKALGLFRQPAERCFSIAKDRVTDIGVGLALRPEF